MLRIVNLNHINIYRTYQQFSTAKLKKNLHLYCIVISHFSLPKCVHQIINQYLLKLSEYLLVQTIKRKTLKSSILQVPGFKCARNMFVYPASPSSDSHLSSPVLSVSAIPSHIFELTPFATSLNPLKPMKTKIFKDNYIKILNRSPLAVEVYK